MADLKISQLSAATALAGTEVVPVVQSGLNILFAMTCKVA